MASSSSTFTAPNPNINYCYDIFLNHRGPDVRKTFARSLYLRLYQKGLRVFLDKEELQAGYYFPPQIKQAIKTAKVHVAIFSPGYAESSWCLDELLMMVDSKAPIIPVFYLVPPADIRWTKGKYAEDLQKLSKKETEEGKRRYDSKVIENWRAALSLVADYQGFELEICNGEELQLELELELLDKLVESLSKMVEMVKKPDSYVAKYPTGLEMKLKDFEETVLLQQQQTGKSQIVGLGGVGKTTLAKEFFNRNKSNYHKSWFLPDVGENAGKGSLNSLQKELLKSCSSKALIILDDVDHSDQVEAHLPFDLSFGSLVLITSRDKQVLTSSKVESSSIYELTGLNYDHSRELFCYHAFNQTFPFPRFEFLVDTFLEVFKGLPISLKLSGANLYGRDISYWEEELKSFPSEINDTLKISYNALDVEEKQILLDVACFFRGLDRDMAISIWNESGWKGSRGFKNLQDKCLVEVDDSNMIEMHAHVRDMGRDLAEKSSPHRLWRWRDNLIDDQQSSVITARGVKMDLSEYNAYGDVLRQISARRLRILDTEGFVLERILKRAEYQDSDGGLLWLRWVDCPYSSLPSWIPMKELRYLEVSGSLLNTLWERESESESQAPLQLPIFVEWLVINNCVTLKSIRWLDRLILLRRLSVNGCFELKELPTSPLVSLEEFSANGCVKLKNILGLGQCVRLRKLSVMGCSDLEELPSMKILVSLEELWANGCVKLKSICGLEQISRLRQLNVSGCSDLKELPNMAALVYLEKLWVNGCVQLRRIPEGFNWLTRLKHLNISDCSELEELPSFERLVTLEELSTKGFVKLKSIQGLEWLRNLRQLNVSGCSQLEELPSMKAFVFLEELWVAGCVKLKSLRELNHATNLRVLDISGCSGLEGLGLPCMGYWERIA